MNNKIIVSKRMSKNVIYTFFCSCNNYKCAIDCNYSCKIYYCNQHLHNEKPHEATAVINHLTY